MSLFKSLFYYYKFIAHNKKVFAFNRKKLKKNVILCELHNHSSSHIPLSYFLNFLSNKLNCSIVGYSIFQEIIY